MFELFVIILFGWLFINAIRLTFKVAWSLAKIIAVILFTVAEFILSSLTGITHDTLCTMFFGFHGGEIFCACLIKRLKLKKETQNE